MCFTDEIQNMGKLIEMVFTSDRRLEEKYGERLPRGKHTYSEEIHSTVYGYSVYSSESNSD